jgi:hypothetical protein
MGTIGITSFKVVYTQGPKKVVETVKLQFQKDWVLQVTFEISTAAVAKMVQEGRTKTI